MRNFGLNISSTTYIAMYLKNAWLLINTTLYQPEVIQGNSFGFLLNGLTLNFPEIKINTFR